eukprot:5843616-Prymnesium_polylepis.1
MAQAEVYSCGRPRPTRGTTRMTQYGQEDKLDAAGRPAAPDAQNAALSRRQSGQRCARPARMRGAVHRAAAAKTEHLGNAHM